MSATIVGNISVTIFGESHQKAIGMVIDGLPAGTKIDENEISKALESRKTHDFLSTSRNEEDKVIFLSGVLNGLSTGAPLAFIIENKDVHSEDYNFGIIRPSHADLTQFKKYNGFNDYRGGGYSSGRITASIIVLGAICNPILKKYGIEIFSHIKTLHGIKDISSSSLESDLKILKDVEFPVINEDSRKQMIQEILKAKENDDSVGGELETIILNAPIGLGEPYFDSFESYLSQLIFSVGGVKGINFGNTEAFINKLGSQVNDQLKYNSNKEIEFLTNNSGGINGGITNGQPIVFKTIIKPTSSIAKEQSTIDIGKEQNIKLEIKGRHDPCIVHRVKPVIEALCAYALVNLIMSKESKNI